MKHIFTKAILVGCLLFLSIFNSEFTYAQIAAWDFTGLNTVATATATVFNSNLVSTSGANNVTRGPGAAASAGSNSFRTTGFQNNGIAITNTDYFQITLTATTGFNLSLSTIDARMTGTATFAASPGVSNQYAYSLDGVNFTLIGSPLITIGTSVSLPQIDLTSISALQNVAAGTTVTFRYYASGQTSTGGWGYFSSASGLYGLAIGGTLTPVSSCTTPGVPVCSIPNSICVGNTATIIGGGSSPAATTYTYWNTASGGTQITNGVVGNDLTTSSNLTQGTYPFYVQAENGTCVSASRQQVDVVVNANATATVTGGGNACGSNSAPDVSISFTGAAPYDFTYNDGTNATQVVGNSSNPYLITNPTSGTYSVTAVSGAGCSGTSTGSAIVTSSVLPTVTASALPATICANLSSTLTASGASTYVWLPGNLSGASIISPSTINSYTVTGTDAIGCSNSTVVSFVVNALPTITATALPLAICEGLTTTITASGADTYEWQPGTLSGTSIISPSTINSYTITGTDANTCSNTTVVGFIVNSLPTVTAAASDTTICQNTSTTLIGGGANDYVWMPGNLTASPNVNLTANQTYTVTGTDGNNCVNTASIEINVTMPPTISASANPSSICIGQSSILNANGAISYSWMPGNLTASPAIFPSTTETYTVTGTDANGCEGTSIAIVNVNTILSSTLAPTSSCYTFSNQNGLNVYKTANCEPIGLINSTSDLGQTEMCVNLVSNQSWNGEPYSDRVYTITPTNNNIASTVCLNYSPADLASAGITNPNEICITKISGGALGVGNATEIPNVSLSITNSSFGTEVCFPVTSFSTFYCHTCNTNNAPLPVIIDNFFVKQHGSNDVVSWVTQIESNNSYFNLLHSSDGKNFNVIAKINSKGVNGNSANPLAYEFENTKANKGANYYQLQQIDLNGKVTFVSKYIQSVHEQTNNSIFTYPNPVSNLLQIDMYLAKEQNTTIKIINVFGQVVKSFSQTPNQGFSKLQLDLTNLAAGLYSIQVVGQKEILHTAKFSKL